MAGGTSCVRKSNEPRKYHGRGPDGYIEGPYHGRVTNVDLQKSVRPDRNVLPRHSA